MIALISAIAPLIVRLGLGFLGMIKASKESKALFIESVANLSRENTSTKLRKEYKDLLSQFDKKQKNDVY